MGGVVDDAELDVVFLCLKIIGNKKCAYNEYYANSIDVFFHKMDFLLRIVPLAG